MDEMKNTRKQEPIADEQLAKVSGGKDFTGAKAWPHTLSAAGKENYTGTCPFCKKEVNNLSQHTKTCSANNIPGLFQEL